ncbi:MAG: M16 family metallopeptidase [Gemmatimonadaceae bacterium]
MSRALTRLVSLLAVAASPAAAQDAADSVPVSYEVNGLRIIHLRRPTTTDVIAVSLYFLGGARTVTNANAGIEPLVLMASQYGTKNYPAEAARRALARTGSRITVAPESDWTVFTVHGVKQEFDSTWAVFADRVMHPTLDSASVSIVRKRMLGAVARRLASPEDQLDALADSIAFRGHPYAVSPSGNETSLKALTTADLHGFVRDQFVTSRMLMVLVGDVPRAQVEGAVTRTLGTLPKGTYSWTLPPPVRPSKPEFIVADRMTHTDYILGYIGGPERSSPQYPAFERTMSLLSGWINYEVRERNGLSYAAHVRLMERGAPGGAIYMSTTRPDTAMKLVHAIIKRFDENISIPRYILQRSAKSFDAAYLYATESASAHADLLARAQLYDGDFRVAARQGEIMSKVAFLDIRRTVREYVRNIQYAFVGDTTRLPREQFTKR